jgi:hypothetical protein
MVPFPVVGDIDSTHRARCAASHQAIKPGNESEGLLME